MQPVNSFQEYSLEEEILEIRLDDLENQDKKNQKNKSVIKSPIFSPRNFSLADRKNKANNKPKYFPSF